jgi:ribosomal protein S12 methylthiotransferase accessory factor
VLERDAFMIAWFNRLAGTRVDVATHPEGQVRDLNEAYRRRGVDIRLHRLPTDHPVHVFAAIAVQCRNLSADTPAAVVGLGADFDPARAARQAVLEIGQVRPALRHRLRSRETQDRLGQLLADPHQVATLEDHDLLYASQASLPALAFWLDRAVEPFCWEQTSPGTDAVERLDVLSGWLRSDGGDLIYANVTPDDMAALGLHTARAILPGFQPIHFGWREPRLAGERLFELPHKLGLAPRRSERADLNDAPHPLA